MSGTLKRLDPSLEGAADNAAKKIAYQLEQLAERARKAADRKGDVASNRRRKLAEALLPGGVPAERVYPPLPWLLSWGRGVIDRLREAAGTVPAGAVVIDLGADGPESHGG